MHTIRISFLLSLLTALTLTACGRKTTPRTAPAGEQAKSEKGAVSPDLHQKILQVQAGDYATSCDHQYRSEQLEITKALDARFEEIQKLMADPQQYKQFRLVPLGPIKVREYIKRRAPKADWQEEAYSWESILADYEKIKNTPTDMKWVSLSMDVSSIIGEDSDRVIDGYTAHLSKDSEIPLRKLLSDVDACMNNPECKLLNLSDKQVIEFHPTYEHYVRKLDAVTHDRGKVYSLLERFKNRLEGDLQRYTMRKTPSVKRASQSTFELTFDGSAFPDSALPIIQTYVESMWQSSAYQLKLIWNKAVPSPAEVFKFILHLDGGSRSYVRWDKQEVHLYSLVKDTSIAHELGHVLGFRDRYYTIWKQTQCAYVTQTHEADLMSSSATGSVTEEHWKILNETYPL